MYAFHLTVCIVLLINAVLVIGSDNTCPTPGQRAFALLLDIALIVWGVRYAAALRAAADGVPKWLTARSAKPMLDGFDSLPIS